MKKINIHLLRVGTSMLFVWGLIAAPGTAKAQGVEETCSNRTLRGDYGFTVDGLLLPSYIPLRGVALTHFDGNGKLSQIDHIIFNGFPPAQDWTPGTGTFHVNADCTGVMHIDVPSTGDFLNLRIVVVRNGKEIHTVVTAPFNGPSRTVTSIGIKVE